MIFIFHIRKALIKDNKIKTTIYVINVTPIALTSNITGSSFGSPSNILNTIKKSFKNIIPSTIPKIFAKTPIKICSVIIIPITLDFVAPINIYNPNSFLRASMKIEVEYKINMTKKEMIITLHMISPQRTF
ncbi:Uncharacterised protein [Streptococcus pneumoniae]|nr:Uncharacterised protein [Streptococcus pneumoniae]CJB21848.1 Uncharacterised protein [Streptococcus pneumoniae]CJI26845.1 Uncharacterised protein [Streptococcus pneumoniae]